MGYCVTHKESEMSGAGLSASKAVGFPRRAKCLQIKLHVSAKAGLARAAEILTLIVRFRKLFWMRIQKPVFSETEP